jgi:hypothetical protein
MGFVLYPAEVNLFGGRSEQVMQLGTVAWYTATLCVYPMPRNVRAQRVEEEGRLIGCFATSLPSISAIKGRHCKLAVLHCAALESISVHSGAIWTSMLSSNC